MSLKRRTLNWVRFIFLVWLIDYAYFSFRAYFFLLLTMVFDKYMSRKNEQSNTLIIGAALTFINLLNRCYKRN